MNKNGKITSGCHLLAWKLSLLFLEACGLPAATTMGEKERGRSAHALISSVLFCNNPNMLVNVTAKPGGELHWLHLVKKKSGFYLVVHFEIGSGWVLPLPSEC